MALTTGSLFFLRSFSLTVRGADVGCWHPSLLPGAGSWTSHPTGQHRSVEVHLPQASWHRLLQLCGKKLCEHLALKQEYGFLCEDQVLGNNKDIFLPFIL